MDPHAIRLSPRSLLNFPELWVRRYYSLDGTRLGEGVKATGQTDAHVAGGSVVGVIERQPPFRGAVGEIDEDGAGPLPMDGVNEKGSDLRIFGDQPSMAHNQ